jgi:hypothetical protein
MAGAAELRGTGDRVEGRPYPQGYDTNGKACCQASQGVLLEQVSCFQTASLLSLLNRTLLIEYFYQSISFDYSTIKDGYMLPEQHQKKKPAKRGWFAYRYFIFLPPAGCPM